MASKSPLAVVKAQFGDKSKLVDAVKKLVGEDLWLPRTSADRGGSKGLEQVANAKLLRLHATLSTVKEKFGTRKKLIDAVLEAAKRTKDAGYRTRLEAYPVPRLWDMYRSLTRGAKAAAAAAKPKTVAAPKAAKAAPAKKAAPKAKEGK